MVIDTKKIAQNIKSSDLYSRIISGAFWSVFGTSISKFIVLVAGIVCANILGSKGYGELGIIRSTINMFVIFGTAGMGVTATKYISQYLKSDPERIGKIYAISNIFTVVSGFLVSLSVILLSSKISTSLNVPELSVSFKIGGILLFSSVINGCYQGTMMGYEDFKGLAINTFISSTIEAIFVVLGAEIYGVPGAIVGYGIGILSLAIFNRFSVKKLLDSTNIKINYSDLKPENFKVLYQFSLPAALSSFIVVPSYWIVRAILARHAGFGEVGMYEVAEQWRTIILFLPSALCNIILPMLSGYQTAKDDHLYKKAFTINLLLNVSIALLVSIIVILASGIIIRAYGPEFNNKLTFITLVGSCVFSSFSTVVGVSIVSKGKAWQGLCFNTIWASIFIGLSYIFIRNDMGSLGLSLACLIAYCLHATLQFIYLIIIQKRNTK